MMPALALALMFFALALPVSAQEKQRIDFFGKDSSRRGYMVVEPETGRVDTYDRSSRRTGWGKVGPDGRIELFDRDGRRKGHGSPGR